ncbi:MAG: hypothetical protein JKY95_04070 [Planctomycetaceae bacterium]|nr:hypothetical protein [Planctomycetaceae bacterium]
MRALIFALLVAVAGCGSGSVEDSAVEELPQERIVNIGGIDIVKDGGGDAQRWVILDDDHDNYLRNYREWSSDKTIIPEVDTAIVQWLEEGSKEIAKKS